MLSKGAAPLRKLQLNERLFKTVPYLGRGSCNPVLESQLLGTWSPTKGVHRYGQIVLGHSMHILDNDMTDRTTNADHLIQEMALKTARAARRSPREDAIRRSEK
jgi:hypothetical protein